ncbi:MAG TPA: hypothetical protein VME23_17210, partial [Terracidiphilus sp.]|nr:hypothetical protein [Terracidiphilus sp.]
MKKLLFRGPAGCIKMAPFLLFCTPVGSRSAALNFYNPKIGKSHPAFDSGATVPVAPAVGAGGRVDYWHGVAGRRLL